MIGAPINDASCLKMIAERAKSLAKTRAAQRIAGAIGTVENAVLYIRAKPQHPSAQRVEGPTVACDTPQSVRFWAKDPDCVERSLDFAVMVEIIEPRMVVRFVTVDLPGVGRHTMPVVGAGHPVNLSPLTARGVDLKGIGRTAFGMAHSVFGAVLTAYGLKPIADEIGRIEREEGLIPSDEDEEQSA